MTRTRAGTLLAVLSNPPTTAGERTLRRVDLVRDLLGYDDFLVVNLFPLASRSSREIGLLGTELETWLDARPAILDGLRTCDGVLLAYGLAPPVGSARRGFQDQVGWLTKVVAEGTAPVFSIGGRPAHPSRWQRHTARTWPSLSFRDALAREVGPAGWVAPLGVPE